MHGKVEFLSSTTEIKNKKITIIIAKQTVSSFENIIRNISFTLT
jgi:hypothetical protein